MTFTAYLSLIISALLGLLLLQSWFSIGVLAKIGVALASIGMLCVGALMLGKHDAAALFRAELLAKIGVVLAGAGVALRASGWFGLAVPRRRREDWIG